MRQIIAAVNLDDVGYREGRTAVSFYECPDILIQQLRKSFIERRSFFEGGQWHQGDHMIFALNQVPAAAFISEKAGELMKEVVHTEKDTVDLVDCRKLAETACVLRDMAFALSAITAVQRG